MDVELQATCSALGFMEGNEYIKEPDCLETVKDLIRFLRRDTDTCDIRRQLGHAKILQNDLIPLVEFYNKDKVLFDTVIKLMVNLTQPVLTCFNNEIPDEKTLRNNCLEVESYLQDYKEAFINEKLFNVLAEKIQNILKMDWDVRREEDKLQLERLFILIRNVLMIPSCLEREQCTEDDASIHDQILWTMHCSGVEDLVLYVASSDRERSMLCMHILEIVFLMFKEQDVETIASAGVQRSLTEKEKDQKELEQAREQERAHKKATILKFSTRHSRFGGTYVIKNMKSISDSDVIYHKPLCEIKTFSLHDGKKLRKLGKNRAPILGDSSKRRSTLSMRLSLKEFCVQFLVNAYNPLMRAIKDALTKKSTQDNDETYYLWTMRFFMQFCRLNCKRVDLISETMSLAAFHYIYTQLCTYYENIRLEKGEQCKIWGNRAHLALKAYQELLYTLDFMQRFPDDKIRESAKVIQSNVFYIVEYRDVFVTLLKNFKESKCSRIYLRDLVESTHIFLKMLESFTKSQKHLVVQQKKKNKKKSAKKKPPAAETELSQEDLASVWEGHCSSQLLELLQNPGDSLVSVTPFDAASEVDIEEQRIDAMLKIQSYLRDKNLPEAVSLFRAAREVWPERGEFGAENMSAEEEIMALQEIFMAPLQRPASLTQQNIEEIEENMENEIEEEEREEIRTSESEFNFTAFILDFAHPDVVKSYSILLNEFTANSDQVNHCVVKMLHRLSHELGFVAMLFQVSIFRTFNILLQGDSSRLPRYKELVTFACYVVRQFTQLAMHNRKLFVDLLFWKSRSEASAITGDYDFKPRSGAAKNMWSDHDSEELQMLYDKYKDNENPEMDLIDQIQKELTSSKTRYQILRELRKQGLITSAKDLKKKGQRKFKWTEEEVQAVKDAFETHRQSEYPIREIMQALNTEKSQRSVIVKILELGLVQDKRELLKQKRSGTKKGKRKNKQDDGDEEMDETERFGHHAQESSSSDEDEDRDNDLSSSRSQNEVQSSGTESSLTVKVTEHVRGLVETGYQGQVAWVVRGLRNVAEDRNEGICVPTPLVPLTEENETAMEDERFLVFLRSIGITPPASDQEVFWRIPPDFSSSDLLKISESLESCTGNSAPATETDEIHAIVARVFPDLFQVSVPSSSDSRKKHPGDNSKKAVAKKQKPKPKKQLKDQQFAAKGKKQSEKRRGRDSSDDSSDDDGFDKLVRSVRGLTDDNDKSSEEDGSWHHGNKFDHVSPQDERAVDARLDVNEAQEGKSKERQKNSDKRSKDQERKNALNKMIEKRNTQKKTKRQMPKRKQDEGTLGEEVSQKPVTLHVMNESDGGETIHGRKNSIFAELSSDDEISKRLPKKDADEESASVSTQEPEFALLRKRIFESDSDSDETPGSLTIAEESKKTSPKNKKLVKRVRVLTSDDEETGKDEVRAVPASTNLEDESLKLHFSVSEELSGPQAETLDSQESAGTGGSKLESKQTESFPATFLTQMLDSDEEDDHIPLGTAIKKRRAIIEEDDD